MPLQTNIAYRSQSQLIESIGSIPTDQLLICVDDAIQSEYPGFIERIKQLPSFEVLLITKQGEATKTMSEFENACEFFLAKGIHRKAHLVAIGGGACSDFGGFVASTLLRGISWSVVPTTLLSMVDAAIGGKTAVNSKSGKNLIGAFHLPDNVWIDHEFLKTLASEHFQSGLGEVVKYGVLNSAIHKQIMGKAPFEEILKDSALHKQKLVEIDFKEAGERKSLNVGHTIGHALERLYKVPHGIAVYWGIYLEHLLFDEHKVAETSLKLGKSLSIDINKYPIPTNFDFEAIVTLMNKDKKLSSKNNLTFAICPEIGKCEYPSIELSDLPKLLKDKLTK